LKIIFAGTPPFAAHHLQSLIDSEHDIVAVYTQPDRPSGRGKKLTASPVKTLALQHNLAVEQPLSLKDGDAQMALANYQADVMVVVAYGLLLPQAVLDTPRYGCLNVHGSLLPRWRGAAPIQRAVEAGDKETGITIMQMDKGLDTGDMLLKVSCPIESIETSASLHDKLMLLGAPALHTVLTQLSNHTIHAEKQNNDLACYAEKITKQEAEIDWNESAEKIIKKIQAFNPFPIAYTFLNGARIKIYAATIVKNSTAETAGKIISFDEQGLIVACGDNAICINTLQIPNKKAMAVNDLLNGYGDYFVKGQQLLKANVEKK
jgi:methionyl-tRNA formyltransferase